MVKRKKRLMKQEEGLLRQAEKHREKIEEELGSKDTTHEYWKKEIVRFENRVKERVKKLRKLKKR